MARCELDIRLDEPDREYRPGERVSGVVRVACGDEVTCKGLVIQRFWRTTGKGNEDKGPVDADQLFMGTWRAGTTSEYRFEVLVPNGPASYDGEVLGVEWVLRADADVPWARDPFAERTFTLAADLHASGLDLGPAHEPTPHDVGGVPEKMGVAMAIASIASLIGVVMFFADGIAPTLMGLVFLAGGWFAGYLAMHNKVAGHILGQVSVHLDHPAATPGQRLTVDVSFAPRRAQVLHGIKAELICKETAAKGAGDKKKTHAHQVYQADTRICGDRSLRAGERFAETVQLVVPPDAPASFHAKDNSVAWTVGLHIDIPRWPDWFRSWPLTVAPSRTASLVAAPAPLPIRARDAYRPSVRTPEQELEAFFDPPEDPDEPETLFVDVPATTQPSATPPPSERLEEPSARPPTAPLGLADLEGLTARLTTDLRFAGDREVEAAMAELVGREISFELQITSIERISSFDRAEHLRGGRRLIGDIASGPSVQVSVPASESGEEPRQGDTIPLTATLTGWDGLYRRLILEQLA